MRVVAMTRFGSRIRRRLIPGFAVAVKEKPIRRGNGIATLTMALPMAK
jgi:hypothetical protein